VHGKGNPAAEVDIHIVHLKAHQQLSPFGNSHCGHQEQIQSICSMLCLLDNALQLNFISERCVQRLKLTRTQQSMSIQGINNVKDNTSQCFHLARSANIQCCHTFQAALQF
jgi:hypothetical protein